MPSALDFVYGTGLAAAAPWLAYKALTTGKYRSGWGQKLLGRIPRRDGERPCLWLHAVSVGEVLALRPLVPLLRKQCPEWEYVISTTTHTGLEVARQHFSDANPFYYPLDFTWAVGAALDRLRPSAVALVELELWPQFVRAVNGRGIPLAVINGRMSPGSLRGYRRVGWLAKRMLRRFDLIAVQNDEYAERFAALGAEPECIVVTGSIKYDGIETDRGNARTAALARLLGIGNEATVFVAGSTQSPEEVFALDAYERLLPKHPQLRLILVPRHRERFEEVAETLERRGVSYLRRSQLQPTGTAGPHFPKARMQVSDPTTRGHRPLQKGTRRLTATPQVDKSDPGSDPVPVCRLDEQRPVLLIDTLGELGAIWGLADVAFVGGSLSGRGGQNMIEPAAYGAAVMFGPDTWNFRETVEALLNREAATVVQGREALVDTLEQFLSDPGMAKELGRRARQFVVSQQGATQRTLACLKTACGM